MQWDNFLQLMSDQADGGEDMAWQVSDTVQAAVVDPVTRVPFQLKSAQVQLGLFQVSPRLQLVTAEIQAKGSLRIVGGDVDGRPKQTCLVSFGDDGNFRYKGQNEAYSLSARSSSLFLPEEPETVLEFKAGSCARVAAFIFDPDIRLAERPNPRHAIQYTDARSTALQRVAATVFSSPYTGEAQRLYLESRMLEAQAVLTQSEPAAIPRLSPRDRVRCERAHDMLRANLESPPRLLEIAHELGVSPSRLKVMFQTHYGRSFTELLLEARLEQAQRLIEEGMRIDEVAWRCGYAHTSNFSRAFTRHFGITPLRWSGR